MPSKKLAQHVAYILALLGEAYEDRAAIGFGTFVVDVACFDQLLQIVRDVRAEIVAACPQLARREFLIADVEQQQCLYAVDLPFVTAIKLVLDDVEQLAMQPFDEVERLEIELRLNLSAFERRLRSGKCCHLRITASRDAHLLLWARA